MTSNDDDAVFCSGKLGDDVVDGKLAFGRVGGEDVVFDYVALKVGEDVVLYFFVIRTAEGARAEGYDFFHILHCARAVYCGRRAGVGRERDLKDAGVSGRSGSGALRPRRSSNLFVLAGSEGHRKGEKQGREKDYLNQFKILESSSTVPRTAD